VFCVVSDAEKQGEEDAKTIFYIFLMSGPSRPIQIFEGLKVGCMSSVLHSPRNADKHPQKCSSPFFSDDEAGRAAAAGAAAARHQGRSQRGRDESEVFYILGVYLLHLGVYLLNLVSMEKPLNSGVDNPLNSGVDKSLNSEEDKPLNWVVKPLNWEDKPLKLEDKPPNCRTPQIFTSSKKSFLAVFACFSAALRHLAIEVNVGLKI